MTNMFLKTLYNNPADTQIPSHKLLIRAGYIRSISSGIYSWMPLGLRVLSQIEKIIKEEMNKINGQEVLLPALLPRSPYEVTDRWTEYGSSLFRISDRRGNDYLLGPTHEEIFTLLIKEEYLSYKKFPLILYQIQTKYRDEIRPRAGLLRSREFVMKDSYSFDLNEEGLKKSYFSHRNAYKKIFNRLKIKYTIVKATSGAMGGSESEEFFTESEFGEDTFVYNKESKYAANIEAVSIPASADLSINEQSESDIYETIETANTLNLVNWANSIAIKKLISLNITSASILNTYLVNIRKSNGECYILAIGIPGDRQIDVKRLNIALNQTNFTLLDDFEFIKKPFFFKGFVGPKSLIQNKVQYLVDPRVVNGTKWITGADIFKKHIISMVVGKDFTPDGVIDVANIKNGDSFTGGNGKLNLSRGIEIGHIFQLGGKYTKAFKVSIFGKIGKSVQLTMGSYGIGVSRILAVIAEQNYDRDGLRWPVSVAPFDIHVITASQEDFIKLGAIELVVSLDKVGYEVLFDNRAVSSGVKFKDAELLGTPWIAIVGKAYFDGIIEISNRFTGEKRKININMAVYEISEILSIK